LLYQTTLYTKIISVPPEDVDLYAVLTFTVVLLQPPYRRLRQIWGSHVQRVAYILKIHATQESSFLFKHFSQKYKMRGK
jgi:hypothetical protein